jgi:hypothetical protein
MSSGAWHRKAVKSFMNHPNFSDLIGTQVKKVSGKPFKSKLKINTVKGFAVHPITLKISLTFIEDDSIVEAHKCTYFNM